MQNCSYIRGHVRRLWLSHAPGHSRPKCLGQKATLKQCLGRKFAFSRSKCLGGCRGTFTLASLSASYALLAFQNCSYTRGHLKRLWLSHASGHGRPKCLGQKAAPKQCLGRKFAASRSNCFSGCRGTFTLASLSASSGI